MKALARKRFLIYSALCVCLTTDAHGLKDEESTKVLKGHTDYIYCLAFSSDGRYLASGGLDATARVWDVSAATEFATIELTGEIVYEVALSPDGKLLATSSAAKRRNPIDDRGMLRVYDVAKKRILWAKAIIRGPTPVAFAPDGKTLATRNDEKLDSKIKLWDPGSGEELDVLQTDGKFARQLVFSPDGRRLVVGDEDLMVRVWDMPERELAAEFRAPVERRITHIAINPNLKALAIGDGLDWVKICDAATGKEIGSLEARCMTFGSVAWSPDGKLVVAPGAGGANTFDLHVFDGTKYKRKTVLKGHSGGISWISFSSDGKLIATASDDKTVRLWSVADIK